jgi:hypothetical protein
MAQLQTRTIARSTELGSARSCLRRSVKLATCRQRTSADRPPQASCNPAVGGTRVASQSPMSAIVTCAHIRGLTVRLTLASPLVAGAQERLCDTQYENCRAPLTELIRNEQVGIDVAFWFLHDYRYIPELIARHNAGVPVRILVDQRANASKRLNAEMLGYLRNAGIPMRDKFTGDVLHFKMMLFHGQNVVEFSKANYTAWAFLPPNRTCTTTTRRSSSRTTMI